MELLNLYRALLRRKWLLIQAILFFTLAGAVTAMVIPKSYTATSKMAVSSSDADLSILSELGLQEMALGLSDGSDDIQNHIALATTRPVLEQVIWRLQLRSDGDLLPPDKLLIPGMEAAWSAPPVLEVKQHLSTNIIMVTATSDSPELSRLMADTLVRVYIAETQEQARKETREARSFVQDRLEVVQSQFDSALGEIADVQQEEQIIDLDSEVRSAVARLSELMMEQEDNAARIREIRGRLSELEAIQSQESVGFISPMTSASSTAVRDAESTLAELRQQREALLLDKTDKHPDVVELDTRIRAAEMELTRSTAASHQLGPEISKLRMDLEGYRKRGVELALSVERTTAQFSAYPDKMRQLSQLQLAASAAEEVYRSLQEQSYQIAIAEAMTSSPLQFIEPAVKPDRHVSPKLFANTAVGLVLGVMVGLALVVLFEYIDDSIKTPEELREVWDAPLLGTVPRFKAGVGVTINSLSPTDPTVEAFRTLRSSITYASLDTPVERLLITSSVPSEGKSTVMSNLGVSLAEEGKRVLIVDCDLRRPSQHKFWSTINNRHGVTSVLTGEVALEEAIQDTGVTNLQILTAGKVPPNPSKLVESLKLRQLILEVSKAYDVVLVDAPPILVVNDAQIMSRLVDHVLMVVESASTPRRVVSEARDRLGSGGVEPLGLIFNKMDYGLAGYGYYKKAYQRYQEEVEAAARQGGAA